MTNYLLLRDNKQSGPYTFDELKEKGLKAYDLVWLEGKSAAWRYPSEVEELMAFAPVVEEQPFDRFYKKPSQNQNITSVTPAIARTAASETMVAAAVVSGETSSVPGKRIIYVTLPAGRPAPSTRDNREYTPAAPTRSAIQEPLPASRDVPPAVHDKYLPDLNPPSLPAAKAYAFEENTSQYYEDGRPGVEFTPRAGRRVRTARIGQPLVVILTVVALLAAGIFIGLSINKDSLGFVKKLSLTNDKVKQAPITASPADHTTQALAVTNIPPATQIADPALHKDSIVANAPKETLVTNAPSPKTTATVKDKSLPATPKTQTSVILSKDADPPAVPAVHRESSHRAGMSEEKVDKDVIKNNLSNLVSIGASGYTVGTFGGISDLQLTISNHSVYSLDLVVVEVQYIQANKKVFKTENLYFRGVAPGSALMQEAPKSARGIKVQYKITLVNSKELGLSYSAL